MSPQKRTRKSQCFYDINGSWSVGVEWGGGGGSLPSPRHPPPCCSPDYDICMNSLGSSFSWLTETISKFKTQGNQICASKQHLPNNQVGNSASLLDYCFHQGWVFLPSTVFSQCLENGVSAGWRLRRGGAAPSLSAEQFCFVRCSYGCSVSSQRFLWPSV